MRTLPIFRLLPLVALLVPGLANGDVVSFEARGAAFTFISSLDDVFSFTGEDLDIPFASSGTNLRAIEQAGNISATSGPLIHHTDNTWTYGAGGSLSVSQGLFTTVPLPDGYATCEAAGLTSYVSLLPLCSPNGNLISGQEKGLATFTLGQILTFTAPVSFDINAGWANALDVSTGPYYGTFTATFFQNELYPDVFPAGIYGQGLWLSGTTVPEPTSMLLLATALGIVLLRKKQCTYRFLRSVRH